MSQYKPEGYTSVAPYILAEGAQQVIDFLVAALDAEPLRRVEREDGKIRHAEVRIDDTVIMIADATGAYKASPAMMHVYVPDVDETYQRLLAAGGTSLQEPVQLGDEDQRGGVEDPAGNQWWIATQVG